MEEEYRMQKAAIGTGGDTGSTGGTTLAHSGADDDASVRGVASPSANDVRHGAGAVKQDSLDVAGIPTIRISTESDHEREQAERRAETASPAISDVPETPEADADAESETNGVDSAGLEKPEQAAAGEGEPEPGTPSADPFSFSNKRLCERWLDNLFMVLYEVCTRERAPFSSVCGLADELCLQDLRVWTIFRAEVAHFKTQHIAYRKTSLEWEILGELGGRLHHREEAKEAFQRCLDAPRYAAKPWLKLMEAYADEGDLTRTLQAAIRVSAYQYGEYAEMTVGASLDSGHLDLFDCF
jgi:Chs5-Arf1p-binding protein BUD7/BCH1